MSFWKNLLPWTGRPTASSEERAPRGVVLQDTFRVAPEVLGQPLAPRWRRGFAMLLDLSLIALIAHAAGGVTLGFLAALAFFLISIRRSSTHPLRRWARVAAALVGSFVLFVTILAGIYIPAAYKGTGRLLQQSGTEIGGLWNQFFSSDGTLEEVAPPAPAEVAAALEDYAAALRAETPALEELRERVEALVVTPALARESRRAEQLEALSHELQRQNEELSREAQTEQIVNFVRAAAADFGITFGWSTLYFTLFLAWWDGHTPGKRLLRLRVRRLDNQPLGLWECLERFGGYSAGVATGLLGFLQIYWDPNRQAVHDKIASTVVVLERSA